MIRSYRIIPFMLMSFLLLIQCKQEEPVAEEPGVSQTQKSPGSTDTEGREIVLDSRYQGVKTIIAKADCEGPRGTYTSEVHSSLDDYTYLHQVFSYRDQDFEAVLRDPNSGFLIKEGPNRLDTLSKPAREIVKSQEFHKMMLFPERFFKEVRYEGEKKFDDGMYEEYSCNDLQKFPGKLYYDRARKVMKGIWTLDPGDASQQVKMIATSWQDSEYGPLPDKAIVILSGRDSLQFTFTEISINSDDFAKKKI